MLNAVRTDKMRRAAGAEAIRGRTDLGSPGTRRGTLGSASTSDLNSASDILITGDSSSTPGRLTRQGEMSQKATPGDRATLVRIETFCAWAKSAEISEPQLARALAEIDDAHRFSVDRYNLRALGSALTKAACEADTLLVARRAQTADTSANAESGSQSRDTATGSLGASTGTAPTVAASSTSGHVPSEVTTQREGPGRERSSRNAVVCFAGQWWERGRHRQSVPEASGVKQPGAGCLISARLRMCLRSETLCMHICRNTTGHQVVLGIWWLGKSVLVFEWNTLATSQLYRTMRRKACMTPFFASQSV